MREKWKTDWWAENWYPVCLVTILVIGGLLIGFINGWS